MASRRMAQTTRCLAPVLCCSSTARPSASLLVRAGKRRKSPGETLHDFYRLLILVLFLRDDAQVVDRFGPIGISQDALAQVAARLRVFLLLEQSIAKIHLPQRVFRLKRKRAPE